MTHPATEAFTPSVRAEVHADAVGDAVTTVLTALKTLECALDVASNTMDDETYQQFAEKLHQPTIRPRMHGIAEANAIRLQAGELADRLDHLTDVSVQIAVDRDVYDLSMVDLDGHAARVGDLTIVAMGYDLANFLGNGYDPRGRTIHGLAEIATEIMEHAAALDDVEGGPQLGIYSADITVLGPDGSRDKKVVWAQRIHGTNTATIFFPHER